MVMDKRITLLSLGQPEPDVYRWQPARRLWASIEHPGKASQSYRSNLFSKVGVWVKTVAFTLRKTGAVSMENALAYAGRQYFITDINRDDPVYMTITTADVQPQTFTAHRTEESEGEHKSPVFEQRRVCEFPGYLTEKYLGFKQEEPHAQTETTFVLITPKAIRLEANDLVRQDAGGAYAVHICHMLDEHKNEYEITRKEDV